MEYIERSWKQGGFKRILRKGTKTAKGMKEDNRERGLNER
jgi:hypothetical protein